MQLQRLCRFVLGVMVENLTSTAVVSILLSIYYCYSSSLTNCGSVAFLVLTIYLILYAILLCCCWAVMLVRFAHKLLDSDQKLLPKIVNIKTASTF